MSIYQHFRPEEKDFIDQVLNWLTFVEETFSPKVTDFLDPREQYIVTSVIGSSGDVFVQFFGGFEDCERKRAIIYPSYFTPSEKDYQITLFEVFYPEKFVTIKHPELLGSLMGLGLKRGKFGDILLTDRQVQFLTCKEISDYIRLNLHKIGKTSIRIEEKPLTGAIQLVQNMEEQIYTVSSLRLDAVLSALIRYSRQKSALLIQQGLVKVNWKTVDQPSFLLEEGDVISARGFGRMKILSVGEKTKKEKWRISAGKFK